jgi:hypothetical protein
LASGRRPRVKTVASAPPPTMPGLSRLTTIALLIAVVIPGFSYYNGREKSTIHGASAGIIKPKSYGPILDIRASSPTQVCARWSQQGQ